MLHIILLAAWLCSPFSMRSKIGFDIYVFCDASLPAKVDASFARIAPLWPEWERNIAPPLATFMALNIKMKEFECSKRITYAVIPKAEGYIVIVPPNPTDEQLDVAMWALFDVMRGKSYSLGTYQGCLG